MHNTLIESCIIWICENLEKSKTKTTSTYKLKHIFSENSSLYIKETEFIEALRILEFNIINDEGNIFVDAIQKQQKLVKTFHYMYVLHFTEKEKIKIGISNINYKYEENLQIPHTDFSLLYDSLDKGYLKRILKNINNHGNIDYKLSYLIVCDEKEECQKLEQTLLISLHKYRSVVYGDGGTEFFNISSEFEVDFSNTLYFMLDVLKLFRVKYYIPLDFKESNILKVIENFPIKYMKEFHNVEYDFLGRQPFC